VPRIQRIGNNVLRNFSSSPEPPRVSERGSGEETIFRMLFDCRLGLTDNSVCGE
jgi:hypothetical protein